MEDHKLQKQKNANRNRFVITSVVLATFFFIMLGIGTAILGDGTTPAINQEWKEILLLVLGAFLGSYSRIIDFWFNGNDTNMDGVPDSSPANCPPCPDCDEPDDELDNLY
jgi:hypothetical protein